MRGIIYITYAYIFDVKHIVWAKISTKHILNKHEDVIREQTTNMDKKI